MSQTIVDLADFGADLLTRDRGSTIRALLVEKVAALDPGEVIEILLDNVESMSPSFVDEALGRLLLKLGEREFTERIRIRGTKEVTRRLVNKVLRHRVAELRASAQKRADQPDRAD